MQITTLTQQEAKQIQDAAEDMILLAKRVTTIIQRAQVRRKEANKK